MNGVTDLSIRYFNLRVEGDVSKKINHEVSECNKVLEKMNIENLKSLATGLMFVTINTIREISHNYNEIEREKDNNLSNFIINHLAYGIHNLPHYVQEDDKGKLVFELSLYVKTLKIIESKFSGEHVFKTNLRTLYVLFEEYNL